MTKRRILTSVLTLVLVVGLVFGVLAMQTSALDSTVESGDWLSTSGNTLVQCSDENCDHDNCYAYSFVAVGDTQNLNIADVRDSNASYMATLYNWILANQESKNIQYVLGLGDITQAYNRTYSSGIWVQEWLNAAEAVSLLDGKIGYSLVRGNHDISDATDGFNGVFGRGDKLANGVDNQYYEDLVALTEKTDSEGRAMAGFRNPKKLEDSYRKIEIGGNKYIIFTLDWHPSKAGDACLAEGEIDCLTWIDNVLTENSDYQAIVTLHSFVWYDGSITDDAEDVFPYENLGDRYANWGEVSEVGGNATPDELWDVLKTHANVEMVLCGHVDSDDIVTTQLRGDNGNTVTCMLIDGQTIDSTVEPVGLVAVFYVKADGSVMNVEYVSTVRDAAGKPAYLRAENQFKVDLDVDAWVESAGENIPKADYDAKTFHLVLDDDSDATTINTYYGGYNTWEETLSAIHSWNGKLKIEVNKTWNIVMSKDYTYSNEVTTSQLDHNKACECKSKTVLDMNGKTFTLADGTTFLPMYNTKNSYRASFTVKNGTMVFNGSAQGVVTQHGHPSNAKGSVIDVNLIDLNVKYASGAKGDFVHPFSMSAASGTKSSVNLNVTNCNIDASEAGTVTLFNLSDKHNDNDVKLNIKGGSIKGGTVANTTFVKQNYPGDSITFIPGADGNYTAFTYADNTQLSGVYYSETEGKYLEFAAPTEKDGAYASALVASDVIVTKYGTIPTQYQDATNYPFLIFKNGTVIHGSKNWKTLIDTDVKGNKNYQSGCTILLQRDYDTSEASGSPSWFFYIDDLTVDLDSHTFTRGGNHMFQIFGTEATAHQTKLVIKNGTLKTVSAFSPIVFNNADTNTATDKLEITLDGVIFDIEGATGGSRGPIVAFADGVNLGIDANITLNDCTIYRGSSTATATLFSLLDEKKDKNPNKTDVKVTVNGGKLVANSLENLTFANYNPAREGMTASADTVTLGKGTDGKEFQVVVPSTLDVSSAKFGLTAGNHVLVKSADEGTNTSYVLRNVTTAYGDIPVKYLDETQYPFVVFKDGAAIHAFSDWYTFIQTDVYKNTVYQSGCTVLLRRNYTTTDASAAPSYFHVIKDMMIDLNGYTLTRGDKHLFQLVGYGAEVYNASINIKNGTIKSGGSLAPICFNNNKNNSGIDSFNVTCENVTFDVSYNTTGIVTCFKDGTVGSSDTIIFKNCTISRGSSTSSQTLFSLVETAKDGNTVPENKVDVNIVLDGGTFTASSLKGLTFATFSAERESGAGSPDNITFKNSFTVRVPKAYAIPETTFAFALDEYEFTKSSEDSSYAYYTFVSKNAEPDVPVEPDEPEVQPDVETAYGTIPADKADATKYPLVLFEGTAESGYTVVNYYSDFGVALTDIAAALGKDYVILVRADYTKNTKKYIANFTGSLTVDLDGHTFTIVEAGNYMFDLGVGANAPKGAFAVKNGKLVKAGGRGVVCMNYDSNLKTADAEYTFDFTNVTFSSTNSQYNKNVIFTTWENGFDTATAKVVVNSTFEDCTFDYKNSIGGVVMLDLGHSSGTKDRVQHNAVIKGGTIIANTAADINSNFAKLDGNTNGRADSLVFAANAKGEYTTLTLPTSVSASDVTSAWNTVDGAKCVFGNATEKNGNNAYDLGVNTKYGFIKAAYADVEKNPIVIFKADGTFVGGYNSISTAIIAAGLVSGTGSKVGGADCVILLRNNVAIANTNNVTGYKNNVVIDLNGYTMNSISACLVTLTNSASSGTDKTYGTVTFKNGTICYSAGGTASSVIRANGAEGVYTFNFENVTLSTTNTTQTSKIYFVISTSGSSKADQVVNSTFTNCVFDYSKAQTIAYAFGSGGGAAINAVLVNCDVIAGNNNALTFVDNANNKQALAYYTGSAINDTLTVVGNIEYVLNNGVSAPTLTYTVDGVECVFVKASANDTTTTYKLMPKVMVDYKIKTSVTLYSNFVYNIYIPSANVNGFTVNGKTVEYTTETIGDVEYYVVKVDLPAGETLRDIALTVTLNSGNTTVDANWTLSVYNYTKSVLAGEYDETTKTLMKDMLVYASAAHTYFKNTETVAEKLAEINTLLGDYNAALPEGEAKAPADKTYFTDVAVYLGEVPSFRFYLASGYTASDFTFKVESRTVEAIAGEGYVEIVMYAYMMLDDVTFTVKGTNVAETYNLYSYYEYAKTQNNANLVAVVEALMKYSVSANAYRNSVINK